MAERDVRERDILVAPNEYAYVQDLTKGDIVLYVGPTKISLSNTERMITLRDDRFVPVRGEEASLGVSKFIEATSSQYIILENPGADPSIKPIKGSNTTVPLMHGRKIVVPGPARFPLWPGQLASVIHGHELQQDQYVVVRVYDNEDGDDRPIGTEIIVRGTDASFYMPTTGLEVVPHRGQYVRNATRLDKSQGLHIRIVAAFDAGPADAPIPEGPYAAGQELFLRDTEGYYFPTSNVEVIGQVSRIPIAEKEGVYVRNLGSGAITTVVGPTNFLPNPIQEELVIRELDEQTRQLYGATGQHRNRAATVCVPPSTAVMVTGKTHREVVVGPKTRILDFTEELERLTLSTGRPKSDDTLLTACFLQIEGNKVSDLVAVKTSDHVELEVHVSYRVSFTGDSERWFAVKNYVGLLCDHLGSILRAASRGSSIEEFHSRSTEILRTAVLGPRQDDGGREGRLFEENGMWVYDVEILDVTILDDDVQHLLTTAQRTAILSELARKEQLLRLGDEQTREDVNRQIYAAQINTLTEAARFEAANRDLQLAQEGTKADVARLTAVHTAQHRADALDIESRTQLAIAEKREAIERLRLEAQASAFAEQMKALQPELISTLRTLGNKQLAGELSKNLAPLAILGGDSVADIATRLLDRLPIGGNGNGDIAKLLGAITGPSSNEDLEL